MEFSKWLATSRKKNSWDLRAFAALSGVDHSSIARIETGKVQPTLNTAIRLCRPFNISTVDVAEILEVSLDRNSFPTAEETWALETEEIKHFLDIGISKETAARGFVKTWLQKFFENSEVAALTSGSTQIEPDQFFDQAFNFPYPPDVTFVELTGWLCFNKALTPADGGACMSLLRQQSKMTLQDLEKKLKISDTVLGRIEQGVLNNVKLDDLIRINNLIDEGGLFFELYWKAVSQSTELKEIIAKHSSRRDAQRLWPVEQAAYNLVRFHRWFRTDHVFILEFINAMRDL